jgi:pimeloyl-ACP methyl ester carboxylesterase
VTFAERVLSFGAGGSLHGILVEPEPGDRREGAPAVLTWNVGLHHHVGPYRYFVDLTRSLAQCGFTCLRFDISGMGDSDVNRDDARPDTERAQGDVREAMVALAKERGIERFILVGFCSGVDAAHALSVSEERVAGTVYVEGYAFRTNGFYLRYARRFLSRNRWERLLRKKVPKLFGDDAQLSTAEEERERIYLREYPTPDKLRADFRAMLARGKQLLLLYVGGDTDYNHRTQFLEMIGERSELANVELEYLPKADHTFFLERDRRLSVQRITDWMITHFGAKAPNGQKRAAE